MDGTVLVHLRALRRAWSCGRACGRVVATMVGLCALCALCDIAMIDGVDVAPSIRVRYARILPFRGGRPIARGCAGFVYGALNSDACPAGFSKIVLEAACVNAAAAVGTSYIGNETLAYKPSGCYSAHDYVSFNAIRKGGPIEYCKPLCAGAPLNGR